ncbi:MAG TPA: peptidoglycan-associated lipoprotein Pal [Candidatus Megaira endosymbiont of Nemacystus decipiens]|nr:peptidoglycan-associated lipoprotein Pal [Candidatus Megaera endosymbiont of Nemacystus decipiens]
MIKKILLASVVLTALSGCGYKNKMYKADSKHLMDFQQMIGDRVLFDLNSAAITHTAAKTLKKQADFLKTHDMLMITVEGHCDERGTKAYNLALGEKRAKAVKDYLVAQGIEEMRITTVSYGKERPAVLGHDAEAWAKNRRSVVVIK